MLYGPQRNLFDLEFHLPAECADRLSAGLADIGIAPSIEFERQGLELLPGAGIACRGTVRSILLVAKTPLEEVRTLAVDSSSRTSVALAKIVLERRYGASPALIPHSPDLEAMLARADAALIIGDPALRIDPSRLPHRVVDLGAEWVEMTGLPMVFAVWGLRKGAPADGLAEAVQASCRFGRERLEEIVRREAPSRGISEALAREYLSHHIVNELGEEEYAGMRLFLRYARESAMLEASGGDPA